MSPRLLLLLITLVTLVLAGEIVAQPLTTDAEIDERVQSESPTGLVILRLASGAPLSASLRRRIEFEQATIVEEIVLGDARFLILRPDKTREIDALVQSLQRDREVLYAERDYLIPMPSEPSINVIPTTDQQQLLNALPNDPLFPDQWWLLNDGSRPNSRAGADIRIREAWDVTRGSDSVVIAIGEEGYEIGHPDLLGAFVPDSGQLDLVDNDNVHGTQVMGVAVARGDNAIGISGVAPNCRAVMAHTEYGVTTAGMLRGLAKVAEWNPVVFSNSWGLTQIRRQPLQDAYDIIARTGRNGKGTLILFASGNDPYPWVVYPGWFSRFMSIGGSTDQDRRWQSSAFGHDIDLVAPSLDILTTSVGGGYGRTSGTSFATPMVAGVVALIASANPKLTADSIRAILELTADKIGGYGYEEEREHGGWSPYTGYGRVNAGRAVRMAAGLPQSDPDRLIWPRGGEELRPEGSYWVRWNSRGAAMVVARSISSGRIDTIATAEIGGYHAIAWRPTDADILEIRLVSRAASITLDSAADRITIRRPPFTVRIDTTAAFIDIDDSITLAKTVWSGRAQQNFATPFDIIIDGDTLWSWGTQSWGADASLATLQGVKRFGFPQLDDGYPGTTAALTLLSNDILGVDSTRIALVGESPERRVIVESYGLNVDTLLYTPKLRDSLKGYRRQIQFHERDGSISFHYNRSLDARRGDSAVAERGSFTVALRTRNELVLPFDSLFVDRIPAGSITFTPFAGGARQAPHRIVVLSRTQRSSYGYDVYRISLLSNSPIEIGLNISSDGGLTWQRGATIPPGAQKGNIVIPTRYNGDLLVALDEANDNGWRDTLRVVDHGYTIESIALATGGPIWEDRRSAELYFIDSTGEAELPLPFEFPYFGTSYPRIVVTRDGTIVPVDKFGGSNRYGFIGVYPRFAKSNPDTVVPVRFLLTTEGTRQVAIIEWDSLAVVAGSEARKSSAQVRLYSDGVIETHEFNAPVGNVPYYTAPSISSDQMILRSPDFTLRVDPQGVLPLPIGSYRFIPHIPKTDVEEREHARKRERELTIYPNPSGSDVIVAQGEAGRVVTIRDLLGRSVARFSGGEAIIWQTQGVPDGTYFIEEQPSGRNAIAVVIH